MNLKNFTLYRRVWIPLLAIAIAVVVWYIKLDREDQFQLTVEELQWLKDHPTITVSPNPIFPPYEFYDDNGEYSGLSADLFHVIGKKLGITINTIQYDGRDARWQALLDGRIDVLGSVKKTSLRQKDFLFSQPIAYSRDVIIVRSSITHSMTIDSLIGMRVAIPKNNAVYEEIRTNYPGITIVSAGAGYASMYAVSFGTADATILNMGAASYYIEKTGLSNLRVAGNYNERSELSFGFSRNQPILKSIIDKTLNSIPLDQREQMNKKWLGLQVQTYWWSFISWQWIVGILSVLVLAVLVVMLWNRLLQRQVQVKTSTLNLEITERKIAEKKLKEVITKNPMSIQILDKDGCTLEVNDAFRSLFGSAPPPGYSIFNDSQFAQQGLNVIFDKLRTGEVVRFPDVCFNPNVSIPGFKDVAVWTRTIGFSLNDSNDKPEQFVLMHENITDRKRAEKELIESRVNLKAIIENTSDSIWAIDTAYDIIYINEVFEKAYFASYGIHLKPGMNMLNNVPEPIRPQWKLRYDRALRNERFNFEDRFDFENITLFIEVSMNPILIDGKVIGASFFSRDITERKRAEEALKFSKSNLQSVINREESIWSLDKNYNLIICNEYFRSAYRAAYGIEITIGINLIDILSPELKKYWKPKYDTALSGQRISFEFHETIQNSVHYFEVFLNPIITDGLLTGVTALSVNITERKNSEQALRNAQKLESIGTLAGGIAHDFNNLMNAVLGQSALALNKLPKESPAVNHITKAIKASERVADLTRQLLAYSGRGKFLVDEIDLNNLVTENIQILEVSIPKTTQLRYELGSPSPHIKGDVSQIQQVIMNLIINAGEAMVPNPGQITLRTNRIELSENNTEYSKYSVTPLAAGSYALLQVIDTGSGISQETLTRIFDPFFTTKFTGRGLGLAAVLGIIKGHKGGLRIESEVGKGTMFEIVLPLVVTSAKTNAAEKNESAVVNGEERIILVIDDESSVIELLEDLLSTAHFKVIGASDPLEGIERYRQEQQNISMVILDYSMPVMDGKAAFEELLKINKNVKVLLCSGYNEEETLSVFGTERPTGFFQKPYKIEALLERVSKILSD